MAGPPPPPPLPPRPRQTFVRAPLVMEGGRYVAYRRTFKKRPRTLPVDHAKWGPPPPILDHFRALLRARADVSNGEEGLSEEDVVSSYRAVLSELTFNWMPVIKDLSLIAEEHMDFAQGIADAIFDRILEVRFDKKIGVLYLVHNMAVEVRRDYMRWFSARLPSVFVQAYNQVPKGFRPPMAYLFGTWHKVFPEDVLQKIADELQLPTPEVWDFPDLDTECLVSYKERVAAMRKRCKSLGLDRVTHAGPK